MLSPVTASLGAFLASALAGVPEAGPEKEMATVRVSLPANGGKQTVVLVQRHGPQSAELKPGPSWFGVCLADRQQLETWRKQNPRRPERRLWDRALSKQGYEALVFLSSGGADPRPACHGLADGMSMKHTDVHPDYRSYVHQARAGKPPGLLSPTSCPILD